jgi:WD40 repeat protein
LAFNFDLTKLFASNRFEIVIWTIDDEQLVSPIKLAGHTSGIPTIAASKKLNWFVSGSADATVRGWK